ncbi:MAG: exonuclease SbcCD subunit D [Bacteroidota bacterium]
MRILHTADVHFGSNTFGRVDPATGLNTRLLDFRRCFDVMVERALDEDIDLFLFCGDAYRTADPTPTQQRAFAEGLRPLVEHGIPIVMIVGNHDHPVSFGKASALDIFSHLAGQVQVFRKPTVCHGDTAIQTKAGPLQLIALPWPIRSLLLSRDEYRKKTPVEIRDAIEALYAEFIQTAVPALDPTVPTVLAGHFSVLNAEMSGSERTSLIAHEPKFSLSSLAVPPIDYVALGHIHRYQDLNKEGDIPVVYSSSLERVTFNERDDDKGFVLVDIDPSQPAPRTTYTFIQTPARPFTYLHVDARESAAPTEMILEALAHEVIDEAVVRVKYRIDENQVGDVDATRIRAALKTAYAIAGVERTVDAVERERRTIVTTDTSMTDALNRYIDQHEHLQSLRDEMVEAARELEAAYDAARREE